MLTYIGKGYIDHCLVPGDFRKERKEQMNTASLEKLKHHIRFGGETAFSKDEVIMSKRTQVGNAYAVGCAGSQL